MPKKGDRVLAQWPVEMEWWYPGVVTQVDGAKLVVQYDDGDRSELTARQMVPLVLAPGTRVQGRWQGGTGFYPGKVIAMEGQAIHISYDDGDQEWTSASMIRIHQSDVPALA